MRNKGFTLIELMIVVAIILIIAAIAIPNLRQSRIRKIEGDVVMQLQNYVEAQLKFQQRNASLIPANCLPANGAPGWFADNYRNLYYGITDANGSANVSLVNKAHADAFRKDGLPGTTPTAASGPATPPDSPVAFSGYFFTEPRDVPAGFFEHHFAQIAIPENSDNAGNRAFFVDDNGAIRAFALPPEKNAEEIMALVADRTPLTTSEGWETIR